MNHRLNEVAWITSGPGDHSLLRVVRNLSVLGALVLASVGCGGGEATQKTETAEEIGLDSCTLCSMTVAEQPAPRAQVVHRDGTRFFLCAASELGPYLTAPSSHGKPSAIFVETLKPGDDGTTVANGIHPWVEASVASYVVDGPGRPVMGAPILAYARQGDAQEIASAVSGRVLTWNELQDFLQPDGSPQ